MPSVEFGSKSSADRVRAKYGSQLAEGDDARTKTVRLSPSAPSRVVERVEDEAFVTQGPARGSAGMAELSANERESLKRQHPTFSWRKYGFEAMRAKGALQREGVTEWMDYYEPGEGAEGALKNLGGSKSASARTGASIGVGGDYTDEEEMAGAGRMQRQAEEMQAQQLRGAAGPAFQGDDEAREFLREEARYGGDAFDISFSMPEPFVIEGQGRDFERLLDREEARSPHAQRVDEAMAATVTRDPFTWYDDPAHYDFPGVDMPNPLEKNRSRSERARTTDNNEQAPIADSLSQWWHDMDHYDLPGVDTPTRADERAAIHTGRFDLDYDGEPGEPWPLDELFRY